MILHHSTHSQYPKSAPCVPPPKVKTVYGLPILDTPLDVLFWLIMGAGYLFSLGVQQTLKRTYNKWSQVPNRWQAGGAEVARRILDDNDLSKVPVELTKGQLSDHYDPRSPTIRLSRPIYESPSVAAMAVAAHEAVHALQDADDYTPLEMRTYLAPVANVGARFGIPLAIVGMLLGAPRLVQVGMLAYLGALFLHFLTLPVEFNASRRAMKRLRQLGLEGKEEKAAKEMLRAAAMTYVASVASAAGYIVYLAIVGGRALLRRPKLPL